MMTGPAHSITRFIVIYCEPLPITHITMSSSENQSTNSSSLGNISLGLIALPTTHRFLLETRPTQDCHFLTRAGYTEPFPVTFNALYTKKKLHLIQ